MTTGKWVGVAGLAFGLAAGFGGLGCTKTLLLNLTKERTGNITVVFVNDTPYTASFSYGTWDAWDKTPGTVNMQQLRLAARTTSDAGTLPCARNMSIGTPEFIARAIATKADESVTDFDPDAFTEVVNFSSGDEGTGTGGLATEGTAAGIEKLLGADYSCADQLIFTFVQDPDAPGGFRIDFEVILDKLPNE